MKQRSHGVCATVSLSVHIVVGMKRVRGDMMNYQKIQDTYVVRLDRGEEIMTKLTELAEEEGIRLATVYGLGAVTDVEMGDRKSVV